MGLTITEALAEIKTVGKRVQAKKEMIAKYVARQATVKDPLAKDGGSEKVLAQEWQSISDLLKRVVDLRVAIQKKNAETSVTVCGITKTVSEWLSWRKEAAPVYGQFIKEIAQGIVNVRKQAQSKGLNVVAAAVEIAGKASDNDVIVSLDEGEINLCVEVHETILGELDGKLSLVNATATISI